jgi:hypothetical protein
MDDARQMGSVLLRPVKGYGHRLNKSTDSAYGFSPAVKKPYWQSLEDLRNSYGNE